MTNSKALSVQQKEQTLGKLLQFNRSKIKSALPKHVTPDRILSVAMNEARNTPLLLECEESSLLGALIKSSQLGLEPGGALGHCYLLPFKNSKKGGIYEVQFILGYKGMLDLAYRSDRVSHVVARAVYEGDEFDYEFGLNEHLSHIPSGIDEGGNLTHTYCIVFLKNGGKLFDVMTRKQIDAVRARSKAKDYGPWATDFEAMAKKSVIRRLFKYTPISVEIQQAVALDEAGETEKGQDFGSVIETTGLHVEESMSVSEKLKMAASQAQEPHIKPVSSEFEKAVNQSLDPRDFLK